MAFGSGTRQWVRGTVAKIAASTTVLGQGEMLVDEAGGIYAGDGATTIQNLKRAVRQGELVMNAADYGVLPSNADNYAALTALYAAIPATGARVVMLPGTYDIATPVAWVGTKSFQLDAAGAVIRKLTSTGAENIFSLGGARFANITTIPGALTRGDTTLTLASTASLAVGDILCIYNGDTFNTDRPGGSGADAYTRGELVKIYSIPASGQVTLESALMSSYTTSTTINVDRIRPVKNAQINGLGVQGGGTGYAQSAIVAQFFEGLTISGVSSLNCERRGVIAQVGRNVTIQNSVVTGSNEVGLGYGYQVADVDGWTISDCSGFRNRHSFDVGNTHMPSRRGTYRGLRASMDLACGVSSHGDCDDLLVEDCHTYWCGGGIIVRGKNTTVRDCTVNGSRYTTETYAHGILVGDDSPHPWGGGQGGTNLRIYNNVIDLTGSTFPAPTHGIYVTCSSKSARIYGNTIKGTTGEPIYMLGDNHVDLEIEDNDIDASALSAAAVGIWIQPRTGLATATKRIKVRRNNIDANGGTFLTYGVHIAGGPTGTPLMDVDPSENVIVGATLGEYDLSGAFGLSAHLARDIVSTFEASTGTSANVWGGANQARYIKSRGRGVVSKIRIRVSVASGNISAGVYRGTGAGISRVPGVQIATTGALACPAAGDADLTLGSPVYVLEDDFLALSCDNVTASFRGMSSGDTNLVAGMSYRQSTAHPLPSTAASLTATNQSLPHILGLPS